MNTLRLGPEFVVHFKLNGKLTGLSQNLLKLLNTESYFLINPSWIKVVMLDWLPEIGFELIFYQTSFLIGFKNRFDFMNQFFKPF